MGERELEVRENRELGLCKSCDKPFLKQSEYNYYCKRCKRLANKRLAKDVSCKSATPKQPGNRRMHIIRGEEGK